MPLKKFGLSHNISIANWSFFLFISALPVRFDLLLFAIYVHIFYIWLPIDNMMMFCLRLITFAVAAATYRCYMLFIIGAGLYRKNRAPIWIHRWRPKRLPTSATILCWFIKWMLCDGWLAYWAVDIFIYHTSLDIIYNISCLIIFYISIWTIQEYEFIF